MTRKQMISVTAAIALLVIAPMQASAQDRYGAWRDESGDLPGFSDPSVLLVGAAVVATAYVVWRLVRDDSGDDENADSGSAQTMRGHRSDDGMKAPGAPSGLTGAWPTVAGRARLVDRSATGGSSAVRAAGHECTTDPLACLGLARPSSILSVPSTR